jgi:hypothetical protein
MSLNMHPIITHHASIMKWTNVQLSAKKYVHLLHKLHWVKWKYVTCQIFRLLMKSFKLVDEVYSVYNSCNGLVVILTLRPTWSALFPKSNNVSFALTYLWNSNLHPFGSWCNTTFQFSRDLTFFTKKTCSTWIGNANN